MANNGTANPAKWTIMIYMAVDDAVGITEAKMFLDELREIKNLVPPLKPHEKEHRDLRIFLQAYTNWDDQSGQPGEFCSKRFEVDSNFDINKPLDEDFDDKVSMGDQKALNDFIDWCQVVGKAENYMLFLWGHGTGSSMFSLDDSYNNMLKRYPSLTLTDAETGRRIRSIEELTSKNNLFDRNNKNRIKIRVNLEGSNTYGPSLNVTVTKRKTDFFKKKRGSVTLYDLVTEGDPKTPIGPEAERLKKYLSTRSNLDALLEKEIRESLKSHPEINLLVIVGCCMQTIEFGFELKKDKKLKETEPEKSFYYVASEELIFFNGYNYSDSFLALANYPEMDARTLATRIVQDTALKKTYSDYQKQSFAISCVDLQESADLANLIDEFALAILKLDKKSKIWDKIRDARRQCRHFGEEAYTFSFVDITWFFKRFHALMSDNGQYDDELRNLVESIIKFLQEKYVINNWIGSGRTPSFLYDRSYGGHGVAIYFPSSRQAHLNNKDLGKFFFKGTEKYPDGSTIKGDPNEFTLKNNWNKLIVEFMEKNLEGNEDPVVDPVDEERKKLLEENDDLKNIVANLLLEVDMIKTGVVAELSLKNGASTS